MRLAVQFQSILDTFIPHDAVFSFTTPEELSDSALGMSTMLQSSSSKASSTSSLRQKRLNEIAEDNEEGSISETTSGPQLTTSPKDEMPSEPGVTSSGLPASATKAKALLAKRKQERAQVETLPVSEIQETTFEAAPQPEESATPLRSESVATSEQFPSRSQSMSVDKELPPPPTDDASIKSPQKSTLPYRPSADFSLPPLESDSEDDVRRPMPKDYTQVRHSQHLTAAESSNISKWTDEVVASTRSPKQKKAPRAHGDAHARPKTSGNNDDTVTSRRVANLPPSVRVSSRMSAQSSRPGSQQSSRSVPTRFVPPPSLRPPMPSHPQPIVSPPRPSKQVAQSQASSLAPESDTVPPEKLRLMKALQMRKRNQLLAERSASAASAAPNTLASTDSSHSGLSDISTAPSTSDPDNGDSASQPPELSSIDESQTTSPTSIANTSENISTKPSSVSEKSVCDGSPLSLSSDTNSSSTPKADAEVNATGSTNTVSPAQISRLLPPQPEHTQAIQKTIIEPQQVLASESLIQPAAVPHALAVDTKQEVPASNWPLPEIVDVRPTEPQISTAKKSKKPYHFDARVAIPPANADMSDVSEDEAFMEELQNATVHEARPVSVNRTPVTPVMSRVSTRDIRDFTSVSATEPKVRSPSNGSQMSTPDRRRAASRAGSTRSLSTALPQWPPLSSEPVPALPKQRPQISEGISRRVKTFEGLSQRDSIVLPSSTPRDSTFRSSTWSSMLKRASVLIQPNDEGKAEEKIPPKTSHVPLRFDSQDPEERLMSRPLVQRPGTSTEVYSPVHKGETVSITARIVRDPTKPQTAHGTSDTRNMHWSPLIVEHGTQNDNELRPPLSRDLTSLSMDSLTISTTSERRRFSLSSSKPKSLSPTETKPHRFSFSSGHKKNSRAASETSSLMDEKSSSRTSRILKRLSGLGRLRNKEQNTTPPTQESLYTDTIQEQTEAPEAPTRAVVDIGEVNVQFPETLLWKRRFLRVDDQGFLIFAPPVNDFSTRGKSRQIHLDELHRPALPDRERQEMAWSIVLDLKHGGTVQCACENKEAQKSFLKCKFSITRV